MNQNFNLRKYLFYFICFFIFLLSLCVHPLHFARVASCHRHTINSQPNSSLHHREFSSVIHINFLLWGSLLTLLWCVLKCLRWEVFVTSANFFKINFQRTKVFLFDFFPLCGGEWLSRPVLKLCEHKMFSCFSNWGIRASRFHVRGTSMIFHFPGWD